MDQSNIWTQDYAAIGGSEILTAIVALVPIVFFLLALTVLKLKGHIAAFLTLVIAAIIATIFGMPLHSTASATLLGILSGLWPIAWIVIWAIFIYNICVRSGKFEVIRSFISGISDDQRVQVLLIAFAFGAFLEGVAGFGIPIAIGAALLIGCGFKNPIAAAALCLVANMASAPTGAIGIPVTVAAQVTNIDASVLSALISRQLAIVIFILPFWLVAMVDGLRGIKDTLPMILVVSIVSAITCFIAYNFVGHELSDVILGVAGMVSIIVFSRIWKPKRQLTADGYVESNASKQEAKATDTKHFTVAQTIFAWSPFIVITICALVWTLPSLKALLNTFTTTFQMAGLHGEIMKGARFAVENQAPEAAIWRFDLLASVGTALFLSAIYTVIAFRVKLSTTLSVLGATIRQLLFPILTICFVLAFAKVADYSGQTSSIAILLSQTGVVFPVLAPLLGMLGVFLTGSVVNSNTLFAKVQVTTAQLINVNPDLLAASNTLGAITGKVISPQSIAIGCAAAGAQGREGELLAYVLKHAVIFAFLICVLTVLQAYVLTWTTVV
ncbi:L-lactate permease [Psittacicella melopsittaci]|uniref:L-lactate permease n=1 Tax=Psittacicella melopsittaci TaxID=2028576 RepID=UPI001CA6AE28|nr:lactate permease LctP family transporter [Psittacicella melopsittaci]